jgi:hypothetical protein
MPQREKHDQENHSADCSSPIVEMDILFKARRLAPGAACDRYRDSIFGQDATGKRNLEKLIDAAEAVEKTGFMKEPAYCHLPVIGEEVTT